MGNFLYRQGRSADAIPYLVESTELSPDNPDAFSSLGAAYFMSGNFEAAADAWGASLALAPTRAAYSNLGSSYYYLGRMDDATEMYRRATELAPEDHLMWGHLADAYYHMPGHITAALETYAKAIGLAETQLTVNPSDPQTLSRLAVYYANTEQLDEAHRFTQLSLEIAPNDMYVQYEAALVYLQVEQIEDALQSLERAVKLGYLPALLLADPGLAPLRQDERFSRLTNRGER